MNKIPVIFIPIGTPHPQPCPDCGANLLLSLVGNRKKYICEMGASRCYGNAAADGAGRPIGTPIDRDGRIKRVELHKLMNCWYNDNRLLHRERETIESQVYMFMNLVLNVENFHVGTSDHELLDRALVVARTSLVKYARGVRFPYKEVQDATKEFLYQ